MDFLVSNGPEAIAEIVSVALLLERPEIELASRLTFCQLVDLSEVPELKQYMLSARHIQGERAYKRLLASWHHDR